MYIGEKNVVLVSTSKMPIMKKSKNSILGEKTTELGPPEQIKLFHVEKQVECDGVG